MGEGEVQTNFTQLLLALSFLFSYPRFFLPVACSFASIHFEQSVMYPQEIILHKQTYSTEIQLENVHWHAGYVLFSPSAPVY